MPTLDADFFAKSHGQYGHRALPPVALRPHGPAHRRCGAWHLPFHGQGMNCALEDCVALDELLAGSRDWASLFAEFERRRRPNTEAIAEMALENYIEMRDTVRSPGIPAAERRCRSRLERPLPRTLRAALLDGDVSSRDRVRGAYARGEIQQKLLDQLTRDVTRLEDVDWRRAGRVDRGTTAANWRTSTAHRFAAEKLLDLLHDCRRVSGRDIQ